MKLYYIACLFFNSLQLIKFFNQDISQTMRGEEQLFGNEIRLFTKIRREFQTWEVILLECAAKGKHRKPSLAADLRFHSLAFK